MADKVIIVVSNHSKLGNTDAKTGWYLPEVAHPFEVFTKAGYEIVFISPKGGKAPMDEGSGVASKDDKICQTFLEKHVKRLDTTLKAEDINAKDYAGMFYAGGHGPMFDLPGAVDIAQLGAKMYNMEKILGAVCHGTVGFVPIKLSKNGTDTHLVKGHKVTSFTNAEEDAVNLSDQMPFMLETRLRDQGATFVAADNFVCKVQVSGQLVTGQNPASASDTAIEMVKVMKKTKK